MNEHRFRPSAKLHRRQFLSRAAGMTAAGWAAGGLMTESRARGADAPRWKMRLSCSTINFASLPLEQAVGRIAALGFDAVDVWSAHAGCPHLDDVLERLGPEGLAELLAKHKLDLYSFSVYQGGYSKYAELLGAAGGGVAVRGSTKPIADPSELTARMKEFLESLKPEIELAEKYDSYLAIENHGHALLDSLDSFKAFVDLNAHPRLGLAMAPYHLQGGNASIEEVIGVSGKQLFFFYAWQNAPQAGQLPGNGPVDFKPWIAALAKADYRWCVNPFMHHEPGPDAMSAAMAASVRYLKRCYDEAVPA